MIAELVSFSPLNAVCVTIARSGPGNTDFSNLVLYEEPDCVPVMQDADINNEGYWYDFIYPAAIICSVIISSAYVDYQLCVAIDQ